jgi:hypothetical protein
MVTEVIMPPGSAYEDVIRISNTGDEAIVVNSYVCGFMAPEGVALLLDPEEHEETQYPYSGKEILTVEPSEQTIQAGETFEFRYRISMPEELEPYGGRYAAAVFQVVPPASQAQVKVSTQLASLFLLNPGGEVSSHLRFENIRVWQDKANPRLIHCNRLITNDGNVHVAEDQMFGFVHITDEDGYIVGIMHWDSHTMLPDNAYTNEKTWLAPDFLTSGVYQFHLTTVIYGPVGTEPQRNTGSFDVDLNF